MGQRILDCEPSGAEVISLCVQTGSLQEVTGISDS